MAQRRIVLGEEDERAEERRARDVRRDEGVLERFGGIDLGASLGGMLGAFGLTVLLGGLATGVGTIGYQFDVERSAERLSVGGLLVGFTVLAISFVVGGWIAGRMARYEGGRNGFLAGVWFVVIAAFLGGIGAWQGDKYNVFDQLQLPRWFSDRATASGAAIVTGLLAGAIVLLGAFLGGLAGSRYHRAADRAVLDSQQPLLRTRSEPLSEPLSESRRPDEDEIDLRDRVRPAERVDRAEHRVE